jgi:O-antigen/teichoic acid export membrane protein
MTYKITKNVSLYAIGDILPKAIGFIMLPIYTMYLSPEDYGIVGSMGVITWFLVILFTLAFDRSLYKLYYDCETEKEKKDLMGTIFYFITLFASVLLAILFVSHKLVGNIYSKIEFFPYYVFAILSAYFSGLQAFASVYLQIKQKAFLFTILSISRTILTTGIVILLVIFLNQKAVGMLKGLMYAPLILLPFYLIYSYKVTNFTINIKLLSKVAIYSLPLVPNLVAYWILNLSSRIFIERFMTLEDVGIYSLAITITSIFVVFTGSFGKAYNPIYFGLASSEDQIAAKRDLKKYNNIYILFSTTILFLIALFSKEAVTILLDQKFHKVYKLIPLISLAYFASIIHPLINYSIYQERKTYITTFIFIGSAVINITLSIFLIPIYGLNGAIYALLLSNLFYSIIGYFISRKYYFVPYIWSSLFTLFLIYTIIVLLFMYIANINLLLAFILKLVFTTIIILFGLNKYKKQIMMIITRRNKVSSQV